MITKISGILDSVTQTAVVIESGGIFYSVMMAPVMLEEIARSQKAGDTIVLYTHYYIEGGVGVGNLFPRLIGFFSEDERRFFEIYTTVKGLGEKKALQSLVVPVQKVAAAIENGDIGSLKKLPGIGGRMADKIIAELRGKLLTFTAGVKISAAPTREAVKPFEQQAADILISQLGYKAAEADELIGKALGANPDIGTVDELIQSIYSSNSTTGNA